MRAGGATPQRRGRRSAPGGLPATRLLGLNVHLWDFQPLSIAMRLFCVLVCSFLVAGCAIRPLPEQTTGVTTFNIVKQIRCETRDAIFRTYINALTKNPDQFREPNPSRAARFRDRPELMNEFKPRLFSGKAREFVDYFWNTGIAYNFKLDMTETNDLGTDASFLQVLGSSTRTLGLGAGFDRQRENTRTFTITDDFKSLLALQNSYCDGRLASANHVYPMAGEIGIELFIQEFMRLALFTELANEKAGAPPTMVDTLEFTTTFSGSAVPKVVFMPVGRSHLASASLTAAVTRKDVHTLTMGLSVIDAPPAGRTTRSSAMFGRLLTSQGGGTKQAAAEAVDQELTRQALSKTVVVRQ
jgi:hypothetical protein